ncbi:hypothetical protein ACJZ2D_017087 [Fusarium nematophilum]
MNNTTKQPQEPNKFMVNVVKNPSENSGLKELPSLFFNRTAASELLHNMEDDAFKLPYSLASYQAAVTEKLGSRLSSKRKFDTIACDWDFGSKGNPSNKKGDFIQAFRARYGDPAGAKSVFGICQNLQQNGPANEAKFFEHAFIGHARICIFANRYEITSLVNLSCTLLARELAQWRISVAAFVPVFGGLVRYVYNHATSGPLKIQQLIAQFAACVVEDVSDLEGWSSLLNEVPRFAADLVNEMTKRFG